MGENSEGTAERIGLSGAEDRCNSQKKKKLKAPRKKNGKGNQPYDPKSAQHWPICKRKALARVENAPSEAGGIGGCYSGEKPSHRRGKEKD